MLLTKQELALKAIEMAESMGIAAALVCAIIEVSSAWEASKTEWNPSMWLYQQHPDDFGGLHKWAALGTRWGPMQVLGQDAYVAGYRTLDKLAEVEENLKAGMMVLKRIENTDERERLSMWFGAERKALARRAILVLPQFRQFIEARTCVSS